MSDNLILSDIKMQGQARRFVILELALSAASS